jgi:hypothetical protein
MNEEDGSKRSYSSIIKENLHPRPTLLLVTVLAALFHFVLYFVFPYENTMTKFIPTETAYREKILYVFVAVGSHAGRNEIIRNNVEHIVLKNQKDDKYQVDCLIYGYVENSGTPPWVRDIVKEDSSPCKYVKIFHGRYVKFFTHVPSFFLERMGYSYVSFVLDDVVHYPPQSNFDLRSYYDIIYKNNLEFVAPAVKNSVWSWSTGPHLFNETLHEVGRIVKFIEVQSVTFKIGAWGCFNQLFDNEFKGTGMDSWFYHYCVLDKKAVSKEKIAIIDKYFVFHNPENWESIKVEGNSTDQSESWALHRGVNLTNTLPEDQGKLYYYD